MHTILVFVDLIVFFNLINVAWGCLYCYMVYWCYMCLYRCLLGVYVVLLGWSCVTAVLGSFGSGNLIVSIAEAALYGLVCYAIFLKIFAFHKGL